MNLDSIMFMYKKDLHSQYKSFHSVSLQRHAEERKTKTLLTITQNQEIILCSVQCTGQVASILICKHIVFKHIEPKKQIEIS